jgi:hypothetical protein
MEEELMTRYGLVVLALGAVLAMSGVAPAQIYSEGFEAGYADGTSLSGYAPEWFARTGSQGPTIMFGQGVADSVGLSAAQKHFQWSGKPFTWTDSDLGAVIISMDFQASAAEATGAPFDDDRMGWSIVGGQELSDADFLCVQLEAGEIRGFFRTSPTSTTTRAPTLATLPALTPLGWYRFRVTFTKLTNTSARIDVSLTELDDNGVPGNTVASGTVADTSVVDTIWKWVPSSHYFTTALLYPTFKNYNEKAPGHADNCYLEIVRVLPQCGTTVTPVDDQLATAEIDQPSSPSAIDFTMRNVGASAITYSAVELDAASSRSIFRGSHSTPAADRSPRWRQKWSPQQSTRPVWPAGAIPPTSNSRTTAHRRQLIPVESTSTFMPATGRSIRAARNGPTCSTIQQPSPMTWSIGLRTQVRHPVNYTVSKSGAANSCFDWLVLANATGTLAPGAHADVIASVDPAALVGQNTDTAYYCKTDLRRQLLSTNRHSGRQTSLPGRRRHTSVRIWR